METLNPETDDAVLHAGIIARQARALEIWEERYRHRIIHAGIRDGLSDDASEEVWYSEVLTTIWDKAETIKPLGSGLKHYSFGIMRMQARSYRRQELGASASFEETQITSPAPPSAMPANRRAEVRRCLEALSPRDRLLVELVCMERVDVEVVAEEFGILPRSIQRATERAMQKIRPCLEESLDV